MKEIEKNENEKKICRRDYRHKRKRFVKEKRKRFGKRLKKVLKKEERKNWKEKIKRDWKKNWKWKKICRRDYCNKRKIFVKEKGWKKN